MPIPIFCWLSILSQLCANFKPLSQRADFLQSEGEGGGAGGHDFLGKRTKCIEWGHSWYSSCICDDMFCKHVNSIQRRTFEEARNTVGEGFYASIRNALNACIYGS